jgi:hypothetical protein
MRSSLLFVFMAAEERVSVRNTITAIAHEKQIEIAVFGAWTPASSACRRCSCHRRFGRRRMRHCVAVRSYRSIPSRIFADDFHGRIFQRALHR